MNNEKKNWEISKIIKKKRLKNYIYFYIMYNNTIKFEIC